MVRDLIGKVRCAALTRDANRGVVLAPPCALACVEQVMHIFTICGFAFRVVTYARRLDWCTGGV